MRGKDIFVKQSGFTYGKLTDYTSYLFEADQFPNSSKLANIKPILIKDGNNWKRNSQSTEFVYGNYLKSFMQIQETVLPSICFVSASAAMTECAG